MDVKCGFVVWGDRLEVEKFLFQNIDFQNKVKYYIGVGKCKEFHQNPVYSIEDAPCIDRYKILVAGEWSFLYNSNIRNSKKGG